MSSVIQLHPDPPRCRYGWTRQEAQQHFADLVVSDERIHAVQHCYQRMEERDINWRQVLTVLRHGSLVHGPALHDLIWRSKFRGHAAGQEISVVIDIEKDQMGHLIAVITVIDHDV
jgi:hypothetical protein